jgi:hypothetical protein
VTTPHEIAVSGLLDRLRTVFPRSYGVTPAEKVDVLRTWDEALIRVPASDMAELASVLIGGAKYAPKPSEAREAAWKLHKARGAGPLVTAPALDADPAVRCRVWGCECGPLVLAVRVPGGHARFWHRHELTEDSVILAQDYRETARWGSPLATAPQQREDA